MLTVQGLKQVLGQLDRNSIEELIAAEVAANALEGGFKNHGLDVPQWLEDGRKVLRSTVKHRSREELELKLRKAEQQLESLKSTAEKKADAKTEVEKLRAQLEQV